MNAERLTEFEQDVVRRYVQGQSAREVGEGLGLSSHQVYSILRFAGVSRRQGAPSKTQRDHEIVRLYVQEGLALKEIGARFGLKRDRLYQIVKHARDRELTRLYVEEALTLEQIGARFGLGRRSVSDILRGVGVGLRRASRGPAPPPHLKERNDEMARLYAERDLTLKEIGERFGLTRERVRQIAGRAGLAPAAGVKRKRNQEIIRLYVEEGLAASGVGARLGMTRSAVLGVLRRTGVPRRSGGWRSSWPWKNAEERTRDIVHAYVEEGLSMREVGARFGVHPLTVRRVLEAAGVSRRINNSRLTDVTQRNQEIARTYVQEGLTLKEVAARFSLTRNRVSQILEKASVSRRKYPGELVQRNQDIIRAYLEDGLTRREVARRFGMSPSAVNHVLGKAGVRRTQPDAK